MSLRDYFAGQALAGLASRLWALSEGELLGHPPKEVLAVNAYEIADAMLEARK